MTFINKLFEKIFYTTCEIKKKNVKKKNQLFFNISIKSF